MKYNDLH